MNLKFICSEGFEIAGEICNGMQGYLPNLIGNIEIVSSDTFKGIFYMQEILYMIERAVKPDWEREIVLVVIYGSLYFADLEMFEPVAMTLDYRPLKEAWEKDLSQRDRRLVDYCYQIICPRSRETMLSIGLRRLLRRSSIISGYLNNMMKTVSSIPKNLGKLHYKTVGTITARSAGSSCASWNIRLTLRSSF